MTTSTKATEKGPRACTIDGCELLLVARGLCARHYKAKALAAKPEYRSWSSMRNRCRNPRSADYPYYGGRGISIDPRWESFATFLADMGPRPSITHTLDRVDNDRDYGPANCRWATREEQSQNRRAFSMTGLKHPFAKAIVVNGVSDSMGGWSVRTGIPRSTIRARLRNGWTPERAVTEPVGTTPSGPKSGGMNA